MPNFDPNHEGPESREERPPYETHEEAAYLRRLIDRGTPVAVKLRGGEVVRGVIEYYDARFIRLTRAGAANLFIFKKDILYLAEEREA